MKKYFELLDDLTIPGRFHFGKISFKDGSEPRLRACIIQKPCPLFAEVTQPGKQLEFFLTSFAIPIAGLPLSRVIANIAGRDLQIMPIDIVGYKGFEVLNSLRIVRCLDEKRSEFVKWTERDFRADLAGQYRQITKLHLDSAQIPEDAHFFRVDGWQIALIVSEEVRTAMESTGCYGAKFKDVIG